MSRFTPAPPDEDGALAELADIIENLPRFSLVFAIVASDADAEDQMDKFHISHPELRLPIIRLPWPDGRLYEHLRAVYEQHSSPAIFVTGMDKWTERGEEAKGNEFTTGMNNARDYLHEHVMCPVVFWCTPTVYNFIRRNAHDFYSIATATIRFSAFVGDSGEHYYDALPDFHMIQTLSKNERLARIDELTELCEPKPPYLEYSSEYQQALYRFHLGLYLYVEGRYEDSKQLLYSAKSSLENQNVKTKAYSQLLPLIGVVNADMGIRNEDTGALLLSDKSDDLRSTAARDLQTAQMLVEYGEYDDALLLVEKILNSEMKPKLNVSSGGTMLLVMGAIASAAQDHRRAIVYYEKSLGAYENTFGENYKENINVLIGLASSEERLGNVIQARKYLERALSIHNYLQQEIHPDNQWCY